MIVRCENCQTEFSLDDGQISPEGVTVRCSVCAFVFRVDAPAGAAADQPWQIRTVEDLLFTAPDLATLRTWIEEGRLHPDDQVSRTGKNWLRLGEMAEFADSFVGYDDVAPVMKVVESGAGALLESSSDDGLPDSERSAVDALGPPPEFAGATPLEEQPTPSPVPPPKLPASPPAPRPAPVAASESRDGGPKQQVGASADLEEKPRASMRGPTSPAVDRPSSMLGAVTKHAAVRPITGPNLAAEAARAQAAKPRLEPEPEDEPRPKKKPGDSLHQSEARIGKESTDFASHADSWSSSPRPAAESASFDDLDPPKKKRSLGGLFALLGVITAVGIMFGVPDVRNWLLNLGQGGSGQEQGPLNIPEIAAADAAMGALGLADIDAAESDLQRAIDTGGHEGRALAALKVAQSDLLATRSLLYMMTATVDTPNAEDHSERARDDLDRGARVFDSLPAPGDDDSVKLARARIRLAEGRSPEEVKALLPSAGAEEMALVCDGAVLWRDPKAQVPPDLIAGLQADPDLGALGRSVLALALLRSGDRKGARNLAERMLAVKSDQPIAAAIARATGSNVPEVAAPEGEGGTDATPDAGDGDGDESEPATEPKGGKKGGKGGGGGGKPRLDKLIDQGCSQVEGGQAGAGVSTLLKAFDLAPRDVDVLTCLGKGYSKQGNQGRASHFYDLALKQSPRHRGALKGAAAAADKAGNKKRALSLYERLLKVDPTNAKAKLYVAQNGGGGQAPKPEAPKPEAPKPQPPAPAPAPSGGGTPAP